MGKFILLCLTLFVVSLVADAEIVCDDVVGDDDSSTFDCLQEQRAETIKRSFGYKLANRFRKENKRSFGYKLANRFRNENKRDFGDNLADILHDADKRSFGHKLANRFANMS